MRFYIGVTDNQWFKYLSLIKPDEVNFWRPGGKASFAALEPGAPFLFKLHSPQDYVVGGGYFVSHSFLPLSMAWEVFGTKNGAPDFETFRSAILNRREPGGGPDPVIGNIVLTEPFFLPPERWIPAPRDWHPAIQQGKGYDLAGPIGRELWHRVQAAQGLVMALPQPQPVRQVAEPAAAPLSLHRLGRRGFRVLVTEAYERRCSVTGERTLPVLQAAHIKPVSESGPQEVKNGILLRADLRILFDRGYVTVTDKLNVEVSPRIKSDFDNGKQYYALHGQALQVLPADPALRPGVGYLRWHNEHRFRG